MDPTDVPEPRRLRRDRAREKRRDRTARPLDPSPRPDPPLAPLEPVGEGPPSAGDGTQLPAIWLGVLLGILASMVLFLGALVLLVLI